MTMTMIDIDMTWHADCASSTCSGHSLDNQVSGSAQEGRRKVCESTKTLDDGGGALKCFYKETFAEEMTGEYAVRCFTTKDPHGDLVFTDKMVMMMMFITIFAGD